MARQAITAAPATVASIMPRCSRKSVTTSRLGEFLGQEVHHAEVDERACCFWGGYDFNQSIDQSSIDRLVGVADRFT